MGLLLQKPIVQESGKANTWNQEILVLKNFSFIFLFRLLFLRIQGDS